MTLGLAEPVPRANEAVLPRGARGLATLAKTWAAGLAPGDSLSVRQDGGSLKGRRWARGLETKGTEWAFRPAHGSFAASAPTRAMSSGSAFFWAWARRKSGTAVFGSACTEYVTRLVLPSGSAASTSQLPSFTE